MGLGCSELRGRDTVGEESTDDFPQSSKYPNNTSFGGRASLNWPHVRICKATYRFQKASAAYRCSCALEAPLRAALCQASKPSVPEVMAPIGPTLGLQIAQSK